MIAELEKANARFQHTAARRRLVTAKRMHGVTANVSTHSRPKAAGKKRYAGSR